MKERNLIILIVGIILVGLLFFSGISNFNFSLPDNNQHVDSQNNTDYSSGNNNVNPSNPIDSHESNKEANPSTSSESSNTNNT